MKKFYNLILLLIIASSSNELKSQANKNDSLALVDLYNSTDGPHWINSANWLTSAPVYTWAGVQFKGKRVYELILHTNNLNGTIPSSIGNMEKLSNISMYDNNLHGTIPKTLGNLSNLKFLNLSFNQLSGDIPVELSNLNNLLFLHLENNQLTGTIPAGLGKLSGLSDLYLNNNSLAGSIPADLGDSNNILHTLNLSYNNLTGSIPTELGHLRHLYSLDLGYNKLSGTIPRSLPKVSSLIYLMLNNNKLSGSIPSEFGKSHINTLLLNNNNLDGKIPGALDSASFTVLNLSHNNLKATVPSLNNSRFLYELQLERNQFTFDGIENIASNYSFATYAPQANIAITQNGNVLSVSAGGTISNNTYNWYRNGVLFKTKTGNAKLTVHKNGSYSVAVTNSVATELTLYSDTVAITNLLLQNSIASIENAGNDFLIYPNPVKSIATISFNATGNYTIKLADVSGNILQTKTLNTKTFSTLQLDVSKYAAGIYFISLISEGKPIQTLQLNKE